MCDGTPCPCNLGPDPAWHRGRHIFHRGTPPPPSFEGGRWARLRIVWRCGRELGHCWHYDKGTSPMEPEFYCCECPKRRVWPGGDCGICAGLTSVVKF